MSSSTGRKQPYETPRQRQMRARAQSVQPIQGPGQDEDSRFLPSRITRSQALSSQEPLQSLPRGMPTKPTTHFPLYTTKDGPWNEWSEGDDLPFSNPEAYMAWKRGGGVNQGQDVSGRNAEVSDDGGQASFHGRKSRNGNAETTEPEIVINLPPRPPMPPFAPTLPRQPHTDFHHVPNAPSSQWSRPPPYNTYIPPHLQHSNFATPINAHAHYSTTSTPTYHPHSQPRSREPTPFQPFLPDQAYIDLSTPLTTLTPSPEITPKLLILDLNGALIYRVEKAGPRRAHARPYLSCFLEYLFKSEPEGGVRPWEVFVWSSAQPQNVRGMVELGFGEKWIEGVYDYEDGESRQERERRGEGRLLGVWARDKMGLTGQDYSRKVQTHKDLRKIIEYLKSPEPNSNIRSRVYDETTTLLVDDSPLKAVFQPWNQLVISEYDKQEHKDSTQAALRIVSDDRDHLDAEDQGMDITLLCVVGILEELRGVANIPAWIRAGGLTQPSDGPPTPGQAARAPTLAGLPSHEFAIHWYQTLKNRHHWALKGVEALARKGIPARHGIDANQLSSSSSRDNTPVRQVGQYVIPRYIRQPGDSTPESGPSSPRRRAWSPSRPVSPFESSNPRSRRLHTSSGDADMGIEGLGIGSSKSVGDGVGGGHVGGVEETGGDWDGDDGGSCGAEDLDIDQGDRTAASGLNGLTVEEEEDIHYRRARRDEMEESEDADDGDYVPRTGSKSHPVIRPVKEPWRTFRPQDVITYLIDVADRPSPLINPQHRERLLEAVDVVSRLLPRRFEAEEKEEVAALCVNCELELEMGDVELTRYNEEMRERVKRNGMVRHEYEGIVGSGLAREERKRAKSKGNGKGPASRTRSGITPGLGKKATKSALFIQRRKEKGKGKEKEIRMGIEAFEAERSNGIVVQKQMVNDETEVERRNGILAGIYAPESMEAEGSGLSRAWMGEDEDPGSEVRVESRRSEQPQTALAVLAVEASQWRAVLPPTMAEDSGSRHLIGNDQDEDTLADELATSVPLIPHDRRKEILAEAREYVILNDPARARELYDHLQKAIRAEINYISEALMIDDSPVTPKMPVSKVAAMRRKDEKELLILQVQLGFIEADLANLEAREASEARDARLYEEAIAMKHCVSDSGGMIASLGPSHSKLPADPTNEDRRPGDVPVEYDSKDGHESLQESDKAREPGQGPLLAPLARTAVSRMSCENQRTAKQLKNSFKQAIGHLENGNVKAAIPQLQLARQSKARDLAQLRGKLDDDAYSGILVGKVPVDGVYSKHPKLRKVMKRELERLMQGVAELEDQERKLAEKSELVAAKKPEHGNGEESRGFKKRKRYNGKRGQVPEDVGDQQNTVASGSGTSIEERDLDPAEVTDGLAVGNVPNRKGQKAELLPWIDGPVPETAHLMVKKHREGNLKQAREAIMSGHVELGRTILDGMQTPLREKLRSLDLEIQGIETELGETDHDSILTPDKVLQMITKSQSLRVHRTKIAGELKLAEWFVTHGGRFAPAPTAGGSEERVIEAAGVSQGIEMEERDELAGNGELARDTGVAGESTTMHLKSGGGEDETPISSSTRSSGSKRKRVEAESEEGREMGTGMEDEE